MVRVRPSRSAIHTNGLQRQEREQLNAEKAAAAAKVAEAAAKAVAERALRATSDNSASCSPPGRDSSAEPRAAQPSKSHDAPVSAQSDDAKEAPSRGPSASPIADAAVLSNASIDQQNDAMQLNGHVASCEAADVSEEMQLEPGNLTALVLLH